MKKYLWPIFFFLFPIAVFLLVKLHLVFFGAYDDAIITVFTQPILFDNILAGAPGSDLAFPNQVLLDLSVLISRHLFGVNGYGLLLFVSAILWIGSFVHFLYEIYKSDQKTLLSIHPVLLLIFLTLIPVHLFLLNYTSQSVLHTGLGCSLLFFYYYDSNKSKHLVLLGAMHLLCGFLFRYQSAMFMAFILLLSISIRGRLKQAGSFKLGVALLVIIVIPIFLNSFFEKGPRKEIESFNKYNFRANDSYATISFPPGDSLDQIKMDALRSWSILDSNIANDNFLQRATASGTIDIIRFLCYKSRLAFSSLSQFDDYTPALNLGYVLFTYVISIFSILIYDTNKKNRKGLYIDIVVFTFILLAFTIFLKWEFRLISPLIICYLLILVLSPHEIYIASEESQKINKWSTKIVATFLILLFCYSVTVLIISVKSKRSEQNSAQAILSEISLKYSNSTFVLDLNSMVIPGLNVFETFKNKNHNHFITAGEYWTYFYPPFRNYYTARCRGYTLDRIYKCLDADSHVYFLYNSKFKTGFTKQYLHLITETDISFTDSMPMRSLEKDVHLFFPVPYQYALYKIKAGK